MEHTKLQKWDSTCSYTNAAQPMSTQWLPNPILVQSIKKQSWQCGVWDNNFMASAKSALYVNPVGRYEQPRVAKALPRPTADARLRKISEVWRITWLHLIFLQKRQLCICVCVYLCICVCVRMGVQYVCRCMCVCVYICVCLCQYKSVCDSGRAISPPSPHGHISN